MGLDQLQVKNKSSLKDNVVSTSSELLFLRNQDDCDLYYPDLCSSLWQNKPKRLNININQSSNSFIANWCCPTNSLSNNFLQESPTLLNIFPLIVMFSLENQLKMWQPCKHHSQQSPTGSLVNMQHNHVIFTILSGFV